MGFTKVTWAASTPHNATSYHGQSVTASTTFGTTPFATRGPGGWDVGTADVNYPLIDVPGSTASMAKAYTNGYLNFAEYVINVPSLHPYAPVSTQRLLQVSSYYEGQILQPDPGPWAEEEIAPNTRVHARYYGYWYQGLLEECTSANCGTTREIRSKQPIETVHDPVSGLDVTAFVDEHGNIRVVAGYDSPWRIQEQVTPPPPSGYDVANSPPANSTAWLSNNGAMPPTDGIHVEWRNWGRTNSPIGLACGPQLYFNCLLAWTDSGAPNSEILYTYFRVVPGPPNDIKWYGWVINMQMRYYSWELPFYADANTGVTAAFFNDAYHLAWKRASYASQVRYIYKDSTSYGGWKGSGSSSYDIYGASGIVGTPTFMARDGKESALVWTTH